MKSFKRYVSEVAEPRSPEEKKFKDQHKVVVDKHPVALDHQHTGDIKKPKAKRKADQEGDANYDLAYESVEESVEELDEISKKTLGSYIKKATIDGLDAARNSGRSSGPESTKHFMKGFKRMKGIEKATNRLTKEAKEDDMPASPDESSMAQTQTDFIQYVGREVGEHIKAGKEFPEWMQNKLSAVHQAAKDLHATLGGHGGDDMDEELSPNQKKIDHNKNGKIDGHDLAMIRAKKKNEEVEQIDEISTDLAKKAFYKRKSQAFDAAHRGDREAANKLADKKNKTKAYIQAREEVEQIDEISQETLRQYHGKAGADLQKKREKLNKGTLTTADLKKGQNRVKGLNRAANKMEEVELDETTVSAIKRPVNVTGPDGKTRTVMRKARADKTDDNGQDKIQTKESVEQIDEAFKQGIVKFNDGSSMVLKKEDAEVLNKMFKKMSAGSRKKMEETAMKDKKGFADILEFAKEAN